MKKDRKTALLYCAFTGVVGGHKYYEGKIKEGVTYSILAALAGPIGVPVFFLLQWVLSTVLSALPDGMGIIFAGLAYIIMALPVIFALALIIQTIYDFREICRKKPEYTV